MSAASSRPVSLDLLHSPAAPDALSVAEQASAGTPTIEHATHRVVIIGGGLAGAAAANAVRGQGVGVVLLEQAPFCGGRAVSYSCGISAAGTRVQRDRGLCDTTEALCADIEQCGVQLSPLTKMLCEKGAAAIEWLVDDFGIDLSVLTRLGGHSVARTHESKEHPSGRIIVRALISAIQSASRAAPSTEIIARAYATRLLMTRSRECCGCSYSKDGSDHDVFGPVVLCTGGYGADFSKNSFLAQYRPDLLHLPTVSTGRSVGDGIRMGVDVGAKTADLEWVSVEPTGLVKLDDMDSKVKILAPEILRVAGGLLLNEDGDRFCNEAGTSSHITREMWKNKAPFRLILNQAAASEVSGHCKRLIAAGVMRRYQRGELLAKDMGVPLSRLEAAHEAHFEAAQAQERSPEDGSFQGYPAGKSWDEVSGSVGCGKTLYGHTIPAASVKNEPFCVAVVTPVVHYCLGGLRINSDCAVLGAGDEPIGGLYAAGEVAAGLCDATGPLDTCGLAPLSTLVSGRVAGLSAASALADVSLAEPDGRAYLPSDRGETDAASQLTLEAKLDGHDGQRSAVEPGVNLKLRALLGQLDRFLEARLSGRALQAALGEASEARGELRAAAEALQRGLLGNKPDELLDPGRPVLSMTLRERGQDHGSALPARVAKCPIPDAGGSCIEVPLACTRCRLPLVLDVTRGGQGDMFFEHGEPPTGYDQEDGPYAYATLLYGNKAEYFLGALVVGWSLKKTGSTIDRLLMHTDDVPERFLTVLERFWTLRQVQYLEGSHKLFKNFGQSRFQAVFTKLQALNCTDYAKVLMLDLDMLVRGSLDELFSLSTPAAMKRCSGKEQPDHGGLFVAEDLWRSDGSDMCSGINAGVMLLQPDERVFLRMVAEVKDARHPEHVGTYGPEQDYISRFYGAFMSGQWTHIHARFNYQLMLPDDYVGSAHRQINVKRDVVVAHYSGPRVKPWKVDGLELDGDGVRRLLEDDSVRDLLRHQAPHPRASAPQRRERIMDDVVVVESTASSGLPEAVQEVMWEWVLALRRCASELLADFDIDIAEVAEGGYSADGI